MQNTIYGFSCPDSFHLNLLLGFLRGKIQISRAKRKEATQVFYDTFEWLIYRQQTCLYCENNTLFFESVTGSGPSLSTEEFFRKGQQLFITDKKLKNVVDQIIYPRVLSKTMTIRRVIYQVRLMDKNLKTVVRLILDKSKIRHGRTYSDISPLLQIEVLRGYEVFYTPVKTAVKKAGLKPQIPDFPKRALMAVGRSPAAYTSKVVVNLKPKMRSDSAVKTILLHLAGIMEANEKGLMADLDTEFLHDFRVSIRRTRSALGQLKHILDDAESRQARKDFSRLGRLTNELRDIDVYLLDEEKYKKRLPADLRRYLSPFFTHLKSIRKKERRVLTSELKSGHYPVMMKRWKSYLNSTAADPGTSAASPVIGTACQVIFTRYNYIIDLGSRISDRTKDTQLHKVRIEGKKLRYLLEFFSSLFAADQVQFLISQLKQLQDNLGRFNDLSMQQQRLQAFSEQLAVNNEFRKKTVFVVGILCGRLAEEQISVRSRFAEKFQLFSGKETRAAFDKLCKQRGET